jgi:hypothetical protein
MRIGFIQPDEILQFFPFLACSFSGMRDIQACNDFLGIPVQMAGLL